MTPSPLPLIPGRLLLVLQIITHYYYNNYFILPRHVQLSEDPGRQPARGSCVSQKNTSLLGSSVNRDNLQSLGGSERKQSIFYVKMATICGIMLSVLLNPAIPTNLGYQEKAA
jgi:hypothetical protein